MAVDKKKAMKDALLNKTKDSYDHREDSGMYGNIFRDDVEGIQYWKCTSAEHLIDIIPYQAGDKDPNTKEGNWTYVLDVWVHQRVGVNQDSFVCPARNYKLPCPICEYREELRKQDDYDEELVKSLYPKRRTVYNIVCWDDTKEEKKGVQVWEVAHFFMEKTLSSLAKIPARGSSGGGFVAFADPDDGRTIKFERKGASKDNTSYLGHQFVPREDYDTNQFLESAYQLDQIIVIPTYDELSEVFYGAEAKPEADEPPVEENQPPEEDPPPPPPSRPRLLGRGGAAKPPADPEKPAGRPAGKPTPGKKMVVENECPNGGTFGVSCEEIDGCGECEIWDNCSAEKDRLNAETAKAAKKPTPPTAAKTPVGGGGPRRGPIKR